MDSSLRGVEVKGKGWYSIASEEDLVVQEGSLTCIGIHQLSKYIRMLRASSIISGIGNFQYGKEVNKKNF